MYPGSQTDPAAGRVAPRLLLPQLHQLFGQHGARLLVPGLGVLTDLGLLSADIRDTHHLVYVVQTCFKEMLCEKGVHDGLRLKFDNH